MIAQTIISFFHKNDDLTHKRKILERVLQFIKIMIYFSKLIDICINRQESQKVVDNYFVGTMKYKETCILFLHNQQTNVLKRRDYEI